MLNTQKAFSSFSVNDIQKARVLHFITVLFGGVFFAVAFGLLAAGVSVTGHFFHLLPRWLIWFGILIAAVGELASLSLLTLPGKCLNSNCSHLWIPVADRGWSETAQHYSCQRNSSNQNKH